MKPSLACIAVLLASSLSSNAIAASPAPYPSRPVRIVVPYAPGGPTDQLSRALSERLSSALKQPFIVENKPGGNTIIAAKLVAQAPADGHTIFLASSASLSLNPLVYENLPYDPARDFTPISLVARAPLALVVSSTLPAKDAKELVSYIKQRNGNFAFASNGNGNPLHLACELLNSTEKLNMVHVPYSGTAPALTSLLAGDTQLSCDIVLNSLPQIKAGKLKALGIIGPKRTPVLPTVPTLAEQGLPNYDASVWFALVAPRGTPQEVVARLNGEIRKALSDPALRAKFEEQATELASSTPAELAELTARERAKWAPIVRQHSIKVN